MAFPGGPGGDDASRSLTLTVEAVDDLALITVVGVLDATTRQRFTECLADAAARYPAGMVLDMSGVTFLDSRALGLIVRHWRLCTAAGGHFALVGVRYRHSKVMWVTGLAERLPLYDSLEQARAAFAAGEA